jgi:N utilization substance protein B
VGHRRRAREQALQMLFQIDLGGGRPAEVAAQFWGEREVEERERTFADRLVRGVAERRADLDRRITAAAANWRLERMAVVDRNVLRLAVFELLADPGTPAAVVIDEAVEIGRKFGGSDSASFINGVLDAVRRHLGGDAAPGTERPA